MSVVHLTASTEHKIGARLRYPHPLHPVFGFVPWITLWTDEAEEETIRPCRYAKGRIALWHPNRRTGRPLFAEKHVVRERKAVAEDLCGICGKRLPRGDRWVFLLPGQRIVGVTSGTVLADSPSHIGCAGLAMKLCPILPMRGVRPLRLPSRTTLSKISSSSVRRSASGELITCVKTSHIVLDDDTIAILSAEEARS